MTDMVNGEQLDRYSNYLLNKKQNLDLSFILSGIEVKCYLSSVICQVLSEDQREEKYEKSILLTKL